MFVCQNCGKQLKGILTPEAKEIAEKMQGTPMVMLCDECTETVIQDTIKMLETYGYTVTKTPKVKLT